MNVQPETQPILMTLGGVLTLASAVGFGLRQRFTTSSAIANLNARVRAWWVMIAIVAAAVVAGRMATIILFGCISFLALREFITLAAMRRADHRALWVAFFVVLPVQYYLIATGWYGLFCTLIPVYGFLLLPVLAALAADTRCFLARASETQWGLMICVYCISHVPALFLLDIPGYRGRNVMLCVFLLAVVQSSDVLQYVGGKLLGRIKIAPKLSPSKTLEGLLGGVMSAVGIAVLLRPITPFSSPQAAAMGLAIAVMGFLGGLVMSAIKRDLGVKDWGTMIEGHGGVLDRMDSVCFAAPVFFHLMRYFFT